MRNADSYDIRIDGVAAERLRIALESAPRGHRTASSFVRSLIATLPPQPLETDGVALDADGDACYVEASPRPTFAESVAAVSEGAVSVAMIAPSASKAQSTQDVADADAFGRCHYGERFLDDANAANDADAHAPPQNATSEAIEGDSNATTPCEATPGDNVAKRGLSDKTPCDATQNAYATAETLTTPTIDGEVLTPCDVVVLAAPCVATDDNTSSPSTIDLNAATLDEDVATL